MTEYLLDTPGEAILRVLKDSIKRGARITVSATSRHISLSAVDTFNIPKASESLASSTTAWRRLLCMEAGREVLETGLNGWVANRTEPGWTEVEVAEELARQAVQWHSIIRRSSAVVVLARVVTDATQNHAPITDTSRMGMVRFKAGREYSIGVSTIREGRDPICTLLRTMSGRERFVKALNTYVTNPPVWRIGDPQDIYTDIELMAEDLVRVRTKPTKAEKDIHIAPSAFPTAIYVIDALPTSKGLRVPSSAYDRALVRIADSILKAADVGWVLAPNEPWGAKLFTIPGVGGVYYGVVCTKNDGKAFVLSPLPMPHLLPSCHAHATVSWPER